MTDTDDTDAKRATLADAFGRELDPLAAHEQTFQQVAVDPFELFIEEVLDTREIVEQTKNGYRIVFDQWRAHMQREGRHPACPNEDHVISFIEHLLEARENHPSTVKEKIRKLDDTYQYWQDDPTFPHPNGYDPFSLGKSKVTFAEQQTKDPPKLSTDDLRAVISDVSHVRNQAIILTQLKLGLRATELCNIRLSEITLANDTLQSHYERLGTHHMLDGWENAVYVPHDRDGNKSRRPRVLPIDDELRLRLVRYLLSRPDNELSWLFLSQQRHEQLQKQAINTVWKDAFHPEYAETETQRAITSHFGRHFFTTFWCVEQDLNRELVKYMRGDTPGGSDLTDQRALLEYIHTYYEDIQEVYREEIFEIGLPDYTFPDL